MTAGKDKGKEIIVTPMESNGSRTIRWNHYKESLYCEPSQVQIRHPNPTRDNGPLVVIKGEHCGKIVRRIHHRYNDNKAVLLNLVVIEQAGDELGRLTGEELELDASHLCLGVESKEQKAHLDALVAEQRSMARKVRAK